MFWVWLFTKGGKEFFGTADEKMLCFSSFVIWLQPRVRHTVSGTGKYNRITNSAGETRFDNQQANNQTNGKDYHDSSVITVLYRRSVMLLTMRLALVNFKIFDGIWLTNSSS